MSDESGTSRSRETYVPRGNVGLFFGPNEDMSNADLLAQMPEADREKVLEGMTDDQMAALQWDPDFWLRPSQLALVDSPAWMTVALAGRGWGKSHVLSIAIHKYAMKYPNRRLLLVGRTTSDVRDVMIYGASGIMSIINPDERPTYNPATRKLLWPNGTIALCYSAERPDALRGIQAHASFCDEVAAYRSNPGAGLANAFDQVKLLTRLPFAEDPNFRNQIFVATTPKRVPMILDIVKQAETEQDKVLLVRGPTRANRALSDEYKDTIEGMYAGTSIGKQELEGEILTDVEGSLLSMPVLDGTRIGVDPEDTEFNPKFWENLPYRVIGVDPSVSSEPKDECGIIAVAATGERKMHRRTAYVLEDASILGEPAKWAKEVVRMARKYRAVVVAEKNQGGEMVRMVIKAEDPYVPVVLVHAAVSKEQRAEPVGTAYERGSVHHVGYLPELESQLTSWAPNMGLASPDRMDAVVHAITALLISAPKEMVGRVTAASNPSEHHIGVKDHSPGGSKPPETNRIPQDKNTPADTGDGKQLILSKVRRNRTIAIGQRDTRLGGNGSYTAPNRFHSNANPFR